MRQPIHPAIERLNQSRERLRLAMSQTPPAQSPFHSVPGASPGAQVLEVLRLASPTSALLLEALMQWWAAQRPKSAMQMATEVANDVLRPLAKRHPIALVAGSAALGALLFWGRPWRWVRSPGVAHTLGPAVLSSLLASGVLQSWLTQWLAHANAPVAPAATPPPPPNDAD